MNAQLNEASPSTAIAEYTATEAALADLRTKYEAVVYDVTDAKTMKLAKEARAEIKGFRVALEKCRVEIKAPALERCRAIDADAKRITAELLALEEPIDAQIKAEETRKEREKAAAEEAERQRQADLQAAFAKLQTLASFHVSELTLDEIEDRIAAADAFDVLAHDEVNRAGVQFQVRVTVNALKAKHDERATWEIEQNRIAAERAELEQLRAQQAARDAEQAERARLANAEAERARIAEEERVKAERDAALAIEQAEERAREAEQQAAERAERAATEAREQAQREEQARRDAEAAEAARIQAEAERKAANVAHRRKINAAALAALVKAGVPEDAAKAAIVAIAEGKVPCVAINY